MKPCYQLSFWLVVSWCFVASGAQALPIEKSYTPGQLVVGWVKPGTKVSLDNRSVAVSAQGLIAFGFGRDAKGSQLLRLEYAGEENRFPLLISKRQYKEQHINGLAKKHVQPDPAIQQRIRSDAKVIQGVRDQEHLTNALNGEFIWPVKGRLSGVFGSRRILNGVPKSPHKGIDIAAPTGTVIVAPIAGRVALVSQDMFYTGKTVMLDHGLGVTSVYAHLNHIDVQLGQLVQQGQQIGTVGKTGRATAAHLHFGVSWRRTALDPLLFLQ